MCAFAFFLCNKKNWKRKAISAHSANVKVVINLCTFLKRTHHLRESAFIAHTMHLICTYSAVLYTNSIQTFSINSHRVSVCVSNDAKLSIACLPFNHFVCSFAHSFVRSVVVCTLYMHLLSTNRSCASFNIHLFEIYPKKKVRARQRQRKKGNN